MTLKEFLMKDISNSSTTIYIYNTSDSILFNNDDSSSAESTSKEKFYITKGVFRL